MSQNDNFLDYVPEKAIAWQLDDQGRVFLIKPKTGNRLLKRLIQLAGRNQDFHIHLDELGSAAWLQTDGRRSVQQISQLLQERFGARVEPAVERVCQFFALMKHNRFVELRKK